jgi:hypothetical protein
MKENYKIINGTAYKSSTPEDVINWLETSRERRQRIRIFYGDTTTGRDWKEEHDVSGYIGRSTGNIKIPLMIHNRRSMGGAAILEHCIVRITTKDTYGKIKTVYQHPNYHIGQITVEESDNPEYKFNVLFDSEIHARFKNREKAERYMSFIKGDRNRI